MESIYGKYRQNLIDIMDDFKTKLEDYNKEYKTNGIKIFEHISSRLKSENSIRDKCRRKGIPENEYSALYIIKDAIGIRVVSSFIDDVYTISNFVKTLDNCKIIEEKDYIKHAKQNGYRSYHMILAVEAPYEDVNGMIPGEFYIELQIRTIAMDTWASLEHQLKYKKNIANQEIIVDELKRVADELASCDISMQTIRSLIK